MFKSFSMAQAANYAVAISSILAVFGTDIAPDSLVTTFKTLMALVSFLGGIVSYAGRHRVGDLSPLGFRK